MSDLIARLEAAEEGSRELSAEVHAALEGITSALEFGHDPDGPMRHYVKAGSWGYYLDDRPSPTESVDDALGLLPNEKWQDVGIYTGWDPNSMEYCWFATLEFGQDDERIRRESRAATPALALCAAILRASDTGDGK